MTADQKVLLQLLWAKERDIMKKLQNWLPVLVASFVGVGIGACLALWFQLPSHTVDVFAFVESALGIGLTVIALIVTLGVIRQRADMELMLVTRRDEMTAEVISKLEVGTLQLMRAQMQTDIQALRMQHQGDYMALQNRFSQLQVQLDAASDKLRDQEEIIKVLLKAYGQVQQP